ncbi:MAG: hypothetical protein AB7P52_00095 [Alphaproteobacteria bacterium]
MRRRLRLLAYFLGAAALAFAWNGESRASTLTLCNQGKDTLQIAFLWQNAPFYPFTESWKATGWAEVGPGCSDVLRTDGAMEAFLSVIRKSIIGERIMHFEMESEAVRNTLRNGTLTAERFFCVADVPFDRTLDKLDAHESCPEGYYQQLFNLYVTLDSDTDFTLHLNRDK